MKSLNRNELIELYLSGARRFYPQLNTSTVFSCYSGESESPISGKIELNNKLFEVNISDDIEYEVIHYTSLNSFFEIINSQCIRMYNSLNMNDTKEIEFGLNAMNFPFDNESIIKWKRNHFILSTSRFDNKIKDDFNMWRLYGQNAMGVGLVFKIPKEINNWRSFTFNEIDYLNKNNTTKQFLDYHQDFQKNYKLFENTPSFVPLLASFRKDNIWSLEKETRFVAHCPFNEFNLEPKTSSFDNGIKFLNKSLSHTINSDGVKVAYIEMPISFKSIVSKIKNDWEQSLKDSLKNNHPFLQLTGVVIGPQLVHSKFYNNVIDFIIHVANKKTDSDLNIIQSNFKDLYEN